MELKDYFQNSLSQNCPLGYKNVHVLSSVTKEEQIKPTTLKYQVEVQDGIIVQGGTFKLINI